MPNGVVVQMSQYCSVGMMLMLSLMPAGSSCVLEELADLLLPGAVGVAAVDR